MADFTGRSLEQHQLALSRISKHCASSALFKEIKTFGLKTNSYLENRSDVSFGCDLWRFILDIPNKMKILTSAIPYKCVKTLGNQKAKKQRPWRIHIACCWSPLDLS